MTEEKVKAKTWMEQKKGQEPIKKKKTLLKGLFQIWSPVPHAWVVKFKWSCSNTHCNCLIRYKCIWDSKVCASDKNPAVLMLFSRDNVKVTQRTPKASLTLCCVGDSAAVHRADQREADESGTLSRAKRMSLKGNVLLCCSPLQSQKCLWWWCQINGQHFFMNDFRSKTATFSSVSLYIHALNNGCF